MAINKPVLIDAIADAADISKAAAERALNAFTDGVTNGLQSGHDVVLVGFGTWSVGKRAARTGRNPQTGEVLHIPEMSVAKFKAGKKLKDAINPAAE